MNLVAGLIHYNDLETMKRTIYSIYDHVDCIIAEERNNIYESLDGIGIQEKEIEWG